MSNWPSPPLNYMSMFKLNANACIVFIENSGYPFTDLLTFIYLFFSETIFRQGYPDEYRANRSAYSDYYADYSKHYNYAGKNHN